MVASQSADVIELPSASGEGYTVPVSAGKGTGSWLFIWVKMGNGCDLIAKLPTELEHRDVEGLHFTTELAPLKLPEFA